MPDGEPAQAMIPTSETKSYGAIRCPACNWLMVPQDVFKGGHLTKPEEVACVHCGAQMTLYMVTEYTAVLMKGSEDGSQRDS